MPSQLLTLDGGDALQCYAAGPSRIKIYVLDAVASGLTSDPLSLRLLFRQLAANEVRLELKDLIYHLLPCQRQEEAVP
jgi:hypothetical protein